MRIAILIDVQNIFYSARNQFQARVDFKKLLAKIQDNQHEVVRTIAYVVQPPKEQVTNNRISFLNLLRSLNIEVKQKEYRLKTDGTPKGDWDIEIAMDALTLSDKVDAIVLVSGDSDFVDMVERLKAKSTAVLVYGFTDNTAEVLRNKATQYFPLDESIIYQIPEEIEETEDQDVPVTMNDWRKDNGRHNKRLR